MKLLLLLFFLYENWKASNWCLLESAPVTLNKIICFGIPSLVSDIIHYFFYLDNCYILCNEVIYKCIINVDKLLLKIINYNFCEKFFGSIFRNVVQTSRVGALLKFLAVVHSPKNFSAGLFSRKSGNIYSRLYIKPENWDHCK